MFGWDGLFKTCCGIGMLYHWIPSRADVTEVSDFDGATAAIY